MFSKLLIFEQKFDNQIIKILNIMHDYENLTTINDGILHKFEIMTIKKANCDQLRSSITKI